MKEVSQGRPRIFDEEQVIDAAMQVFWSHGYADSSAEALCARTGLGRGSLYNAFGNKENLYHAALLRYQELGLATQTAILEAEGTLKERLYNLLTWGIETDLANHEQRSCMALFAGLERAGKDPFVAQNLYAFIHKLEGVVCHQFTLAQRMGELPVTQTPLECTRAFLASYYGLRILGTTVHERIFLEDARAGILSNYT